MFNSEMTLYPMMYNHTEYYKLMIDEKYWFNCTNLTFVTDTQTKVSHNFSYLFPSKAAYFILDIIGTSYIFRIRQTFNEQPWNSSWSDYKIVATLMEPENLKNEYVEIYARGTGARNHNTSVVKIDDHKLFEHGLYRGLHLIVLDRRNLSKVFNATYDTMKKEKSFPENIIVTETGMNCTNYTLKDPIIGTEAGGLPFNTTEGPVLRFQTYFTTFLVQSEFDKVVSVDKQVFLLKNGTFTNYTTI